MSANLQAFRTEKQTREATIAKAWEITETARREQREVTAQEATRIEALLTTAECVLGLSRIPRGEFYKGGK